MIPFLILLGVGFISTLYFWCDRGSDAEDRFVFIIVILFLIAWAIAEITVGDKF